MLSHDDKDNIVLNVNVLLQNEAILAQLFGTPIITRADKQKIFLRLAKNNKFQLIKQVISHVPDLNAIKDDDNNYAIHYAVKNHNLVMLKKLLEGNANYNVKNKMGDTPLDIALMTGDTECALAILLYENPEFRNLTAYLAQIVEKNEIDLLMYLLPLKQKWDSTYCMTLPLHAAVRKSNPKMVEALCKNQEFIQEVDSNNKTALDIAFQCQSEQKYYSEKNTEIIHILQEAEDQYKLKAAIEKKDFEAVKKYLTISRIKALVPSLLTQTPSALQQDLLKGNMKLDEKKESKHAFSEDDLSFLLQVNDREGASNLHLLNSWMDACQKSLQEMKSNTKLGSHVLKIINTCMAEEYKEFDIYFKMDLYCLYQSLKIAIENSSKDDELKNIILQIFALREDAILNSNMDYCYSQKSKANKICYDIALLFCDKDTSPYQYLLKKARTDQRLWMNEVDYTDQLPDASKFIRVQNNEIHLIEYIVFQAIQRLKQGKTHADHIWFGTDNKNISPVPPLTPQTLQILKQRSKTLQLLMRYIEKLETAAKKSRSVYTKLAYFKDALFSNSVRNKESKATERDADERLNPILVQVGEWWNTLDPLIRNQIKAIKGGSHKQTIGAVMNIIFSVNDAKDNKRQSDVSYCVYLKAVMLGNILQDKEVIEKLQEISKDIELSSTKVSDQVLDGWQNAIIKELEIAPEVFMPENGVFPSISESINVFLMKKIGFQFFSGKVDTKYKNVDNLILFILEESDNSVLKSIAMMLEKPAYLDYRKNNFIDTFIKLFNTDVSADYVIFCQQRDKLNISATTDTIEKLFKWSVKNEKILFIVYILDHWRWTPYEKYMNNRSYLDFFREKFSAESLKQLYQLMSHSVFLFQRSLEQKDSSTAKILINSSSSDNNTSFLLEAIKLQDIEIVDYILNKQKPIDFIGALNTVRSLQNSTILHKLYKHCIPHADAILKYLENSNDIEIYEQLFKVPFEARNNWRDLGARANHLIHYAVINNNVPLLNKILEKKGDINIPNATGLSALDFAILKSDMKLVELLLKQGANICKNQDAFFVNLICRSQDTKLIDLFMQNFNLNMEYTDYNGKIPFHYALERGPDFYPVVQKILDKMIPDRKKHYLYIALSHAMSEDDRVAVKFLLSLGAVNESSHTQVYFSKLLNVGEVELCNLLMYSKKINFEFKGEERDTALHYAIEKGSLPFVNKILENMTGDFHVTLQTALNLALEDKKPETIKVLLLRGAIPDKNFHQYFAQDIHKMDPSFKKILLNSMVSAPSVKNKKEEVELINLRSVVLHEKSLPDAKNILWYKAYQDIRFGCEDKNIYQSLFSYLYDTSFTSQVLMLKTLKNQDYAKKFNSTFFRIFSSLLDKLTFEKSHTDLHELVNIYQFLQQFIYVPSVCWDDKTEISNKLFQIIVNQKMNTVGTRFDFRINPFSLVNQFCYQVATEILPAGNTLLSLLATDIEQNKLVKQKFENNIFSSLFDFVFVPNEGGGFEGRCSDKNEMQPLMSYIFSEDNNNRLNALYTQIKLIAKSSKTNKENDNLHTVYKALALQIIKNTVNSQPADLPKALKECFESYPFIENYHYQAGNWIRTDVPLTHLFKAPKKISEDFQVLDKEIQALRKLN